MARIYAYAVIVTVWLSEGDDDSSQVFNLMRRIVADDVKYSYDWRATAKAILAPASDAIDALLDRSWFRRAWVRCSKTRLSICIDNNRSCRKQRLQELCL